MQTSGSVAAYLQELFKFNLYKRTQGRHARQVTLIAIAIMLVAGVWSLKVWLGAEGATTRVTTLVPLGVLAVSLWASFRLIQFPKFADFLISVEAEMSKVSWPARPELFRASAVVIMVIFLLASLLFLYDLVWKTIFGTLLG